MNLLHVPWIDRHKPSPRAERIIAIRRGLKMSDRPISLVEAARAADCSVIDFIALELGRVRLESDAEWDALEATLKGLRT